MTSLAAGLLVAVLSTSAHALSAAAQSSAPPARPGKAAQAELPAIERRLQDAVRRNPRSFDAHQALAAFYLHNGRLDAAVAHLEQAQTIDPTHYANAYDLAVALLETGSLDRARKQVAHVRALKDSGELHNLLGDIEERAGNLVAAAEEYRRAAEMDGSEEHLFDWGNNLVQLRAFEPAAQVFTAAIERHPQSARTAYRPGHLPVLARPLSGGGQVVLPGRGPRAVGSTPVPVPRRDVRRGSGALPEITDRLARFVKARPRNALAHLYYAMSLWKGRSAAPEPAALRTVEALLRRAVALDPSLSKGFLELGILLSDQKRYKEAIPELRRATRLDPDQAQAHYRLAQAYQRTGQATLAASELEIFERLNAASRSPQ